MERAYGLRKGVVSKNVVEVGHDIIDLHFALSSPGRTCNRPKLALCGVVVFV